MLRNKVYTILYTEKKAIKCQASSEGGTHSGPASPNRMQNKKKMEDKFLLGFFLFEQLFFLKKCCDREKLLEKELL